MKWCRHCQKEKGESEFYTDRVGIAGSYQYKTRGHKCKECHRAYARNRNLSEVRAIADKLARVMFAIGWLKNQKEPHYEMVQRWCEEGEALLKTSVDLPESRQTVASMRKMP